MTKTNEKSKNIWDIMSSSITKKFKPMEEEIKKIPSYIFCKYISGTPRGAMMMNEAIQYNIEPELLYKFIWYGYPKDRSHSYLKTKKIEKTEELEIIMDYFKCNVNLALEYIKLLPEEEYQKIIKKFKTKNKI